MRDPTLYGRTRVYDPDIRTISTSVVFQVFYRPGSRPWRRVNEDTLREFQVMSLTGFVLLDVDTVASARSELAVGAGLSVLEDAVMFGFGVSLYRGVSVRGGDGTPGSHVVPTGVLGAMFSTEGEFTVEDVFFIVNLNLLSIGRRLTQ